MKIFLFSVKLISNMAVGLAFKLKYITNSSCLFKDNRSLYYLSNRHVIHL